MLYVPQTPNQQMALAPVVNVSLPQQPLPQQQPQIRVVLPPRPPPLPTSTNAVNVMKETHTIKFCHLTLECQLSYHIDLARVTYYHILTAVQPNNTQKGLFKVFVPSSMFNNVFPPGQSSLIANLVIQSVQDGNAMVPKATISFPTIQRRIAVSLITNLKISSSLMHCQFHLYFFVSIRVDIHSVLKRQKLQFWQKIS